MRRHYWADSGLCGECRAGYRALLQVRRADRGKGRGEWEGKNDSGLEKRVVVGELAYTENTSPFLASEQK